MMSLNFSRFLFYYSLLINSTSNGFIYKKNKLEINRDNFDYISKIEFCQVFINARPINSMSENQTRQMDAMKNICKRILMKDRLVKEVKQKEMKKEIEDKVYRTYLAPRIKSSIVTDFLTMRY